MLTNTTGLLKKLISIFLISPIQVLGSQLPQPAGHAAPAAPQDMGGFLGCNSTFTSLHTQVFTHQHPQQGPR